MEDPGFRAWLSRQPLNPHSPVSLEELRRRYQLSLGLREIQTQLHPPLPPSLVVAQRLPPSPPMPRQPTAPVTPESFAAREMGPRLRELQTQLHPRPPTPPPPPPSFLQRAVERPPTLVGLGRGFTEQALANLREIFTKVRREEFPERPPMPPTGSLARKVGRVAGQFAVPLFTEEEIKSPLMGALMFPPFAAGREIGPVLPAIQKAVGAVREGRAGVAERVAESLVVPGRAEAGFAKLPKKVTKPSISEVAPPPVPEAVPPVTPGVTTTEIGLMEGVKPLGAGDIASGWQKTYRGRLVYKTDLTFENTKESIAYDKITSSPSYSKLLSAYKRFMRTLHAADDPYVLENLREVERQPWELLTAHASVMYAKSGTAKTLRRLADAVFSESKLPRKPEGRFRGESGLDWDAIKVVKESPIPKAEAVRPAPTGIPAMITRDMEARLRAMGITETELRQMTPQQAWERLGGMPEAVPTIPPSLVEGPPPGVKVAKPAVLPTAEELTTFPKAAEITPPPPGGPPEPPPSIIRAAEAPPTAPPGRVPPGAIPPEGAPVPEGTARAISIAEERVRQASPGAISRAFDAFPLTRPLYRFFVPAKGLTQAQHVAWVARSTASSEYLTRAFAARSQALGELDRAFGSAFKTGGKANVAYMGPVERAAGKQADLIGTAVDILPNPDFYALNPAQRSAIAQVSAYETEFLDLATMGYGAKIGRFPTKEGAAFVPNVDVSESALEVLGDAFTAARVGRAKTRVWEDAIARQAHTPSFKPETNLEVLFAGSDAAKANLIAGEVFKTRLGGLTKLEVLQETHPQLAGKMLALRQRVVSLRGSAGRLETKIQEAVDDFLASAIEDADLMALRDGLDVKLVRGPREGMNIAAIQKEIDGVRAQIRGLQPSWKAANLKPYVFVQEGVYRYFPVKEAKSLRQLLEVSNNPALSLAWEIRNVSFNLDLSPITGVHLPLGFLADPVGTSRQLVKGTSTAIQRRQWLGGLSPSALADKIASDPTWAEFAAVSGRPVGATATEFAGGILRRIPGYSKVNEGMFTAVTYRSKAMFDDLVKGLEKAGIPHNEAIVAASENVHRAIPLVDPALLGQSQARAKLLQSITISPSFLLRPPELVAEATKALVKAGLKQPLTSKEKMALRVALTMLATIETISVSTAVIDAYKHGKDPGKAAIDALDALAIHLLDGRKIPLGGPFRSLVNAMKPRWINKEMDYMMPFVGVPRWLIGKITPALRTQYDLIRNKDFFGRRIVTGDFPLNILQIIAYEFEGAVPLSMSAWIEGLRTGATFERTAEEAVTQLMGTSLYERPGPWALRGEWREELRSYWAIPSNAREARVGYMVEGKKKTQTRQQFRKANPKVDARLFIVGEVESLLTISAKLMAVRLMRENNLKISDIRGLEKEEFESKDRTALRKYFERALGITAPTPAPVPGVAPVSGPAPTPKQEWEWYVGEDGKVRVRERVPIPTPVPAGVR